MPFRTVPLAIAAVLIALSSRADVVPRLSETDPIRSAIGASRLGAVARAPCACR